MISSKLIKHLKKTNAHTQAHTALLSAPTYYGAAAASSSSSSSPSSSSLGSPPASASSSRSASPNPSPAVSPQPSPLSSPFASPLTSPSHRSHTRRLDGAPPLPLQTHSKTRTRARKGEVPLSANMMVYKIQKKLKYNLTLPVSFACSDKNMGVHLHEYEKLCSTDKQFAGEAASLRRDITGLYRILQGLCMRNVCSGSSSSTSSSDGKTNSSSHLGSGGGASSAGSEEVMRSYSNQARAIPLLLCSRVLDEVVARLYPAIPWP